VDQTEVMKSLIGGEGSQVYADVGLAQCWLLFP
jgi:hypothetical protein